MHHLQFLFIHVSFALNNVIIMCRFGLVNNTDGRINEVYRRRARLVGLLRRVAVGKR